MIRIRNQLLILFLLTAVVLLFLLETYSSFEHQNLLKNNIDQSIETISILKSKNINNLIDSYYDKINLTTSRLLLKQELKKYYDTKNNSEQIGNILNPTLVSNPDFFEISIADTNGKLIFSTNENLINTDFSGYEFYEKSTVQNTVSDLFYENGDSFFYFSAPLFLDSEFLGTVIAKVIPDKFFEVTEDYHGLGNTGESYILNNEFYAMSPLRGFEEIKIEKKITTDLAVECFDKNLESRVILFSRYKGEKLIGAYSYIPSANWCLIVEIEEKEAYSGIYMLRFFLYSAYVLIILVIILISYIYSRSFSNSILNISKDIEEITKGNLEITPKESDIYEIQSLNSSLNRILASLKLAVIKGGVSKEELGFKEAVLAKEKAEESIIKEKEISNTYLEVSNLMMISINREGKVSNINKKGCEILGYKKEEIQGKDWFNNFLPKNARIETKRVFNQMVSGKIKPFETHENLILTKDGRERLIFWKNSTIFDEKGRIIETISSGEDVTEKRKYEEEIKKSEEKFRTIAENVSDIIYSVDMNGKIIYVNPVIERYGYKVNEVLSKNVFDLIHPDDKKMLIKNFAYTMLTGKDVPSTIRFFTKDKKILIFQERGTPIRNEKGKIISTVGVMRDVTELKQTMESLEKSEENYRAIFNSVNETILIFDKKGIVIDVNDRMYEVAGYKKEELIGKRITYLMKLTDKKSRRLLLSNFAKRMMGFKIKPYIVNFVHKDGKWFSYEINATPLKLKGKIIGDIVLFRNVDRLIKLEKSMDIIFSSTPSISKANKKEEAYSLILDSILKIDEVDCGGIYEFLENGDLNLEISKGLSKGFISKVKYYPSNSPNVKLIKGGKSTHILYSDLLKKIGLKEKLKGISVISVKYDNKVVGAINIASHKYDNFSESTLSAIEVLAVNLGQIIDKFKK